MCRVPSVRSGGHDTIRVRVAGVTKRPEQHKEKKKKKKRNVYSVAKIKCVRAGGRTTIYYCGGGGTLTSDCRRRRRLATHALTLARTTRTHTNTRRRTDRRASATVKYTPTHTYTNTRAHSHDTDDRVNDSKTRTAKTNGIRRRPFVRPEIRPRVRASVFPPCVAGACVRAERAAIVVGGSDIRTPF